MDGDPTRVYRLMREDNLLCLRRRKFVITTDSDHGLPVYPNRARELVLTGLDQLWVADITYLRLKLEFVYRGGDSGRLLAPRPRLGAGPHAGSQADPGGPAHGAAATQARARPGASLRSRRAVRLHRLHGLAAGKRYRHQHEPTRQPLRQCHVRDRSSRHSNTRRYTARNIATWPRPVPRSACFWKRSITRNACTRRSAICLRQSLSAVCWPNPRRRPLRGSFLCEFSEA